MFTPKEVLFILEIIPESLFIMARDLFKSSLLFQLHQDQDSASLYMQDQEWSFNHQVDKPTLHYLHLALKSPLAPKTVYIRFGK